MENISKRWPFIAALIKEWVGAMTGVLGLLFTVLAVYLDNSYLQALLAVLAVIALPYAFYRVWRGEYEAKLAAEQKERVALAQLDERVRRRNIRVQLGAFLDDGGALMTRCADQQSLPPAGDANRWAATVEEFLATNLDTSFVARFRDDSDLPLTANSISLLDHRNLWSWVRTRKARLQQFIQKLGE